MILQILLNYGLISDLMMVFLTLWLQGLVKMVVEWRERENDDVDALALEDEACMDALRDCGLKKFFLTSYLRAQPELLRFIMDAWDIEDQVFRLRDQTLELDVSDVYFSLGYRREVHDPF